MASTAPPSMPAQSPASATQTTSSTSTLPSPLPLPRVTIRFCTQCKWMLRAAYFAQELLSTFSTALGEVALQPATGGIFVVEIFHAGESALTDPSNPVIQHRVLWDRKVDGGFPETKELKRRVRDVIEPGRNLGHVDRDYPRQSKEEVGKESNAAQAGTAAESSRSQRNVQPPGPRWPELHSQGQSSQPGTAQGQETASPEVAAQTKTLADLGLHSRTDNTGTDGSVYDPKMLNGGIMPVMPPRAASSRLTSQEQSSPAQCPPRQNEEVCEDCQ